MRPIEFRAWDEKYQVGSDGSVWSLDYNHTGSRKKMKQYLDRDGYPHVFLTHSGKRTKSVVHRMVAKLFFVQPSTKHQVNHKNGIRNDNRIQNLEWVTAKENVIHSWKSGRKVSPKVIENGRKRFSGENNPKAKLTAEKARLIWRLRNLYGWTLEALSNDYGISKSQASAIANRKSWVNR